MGHPAKDADERGNAAMGRESTPPCVETTDARMGHPAPGPWHPALGTRPSALGKWNEFKTQDKSFIKAFPRGAATSR